MTIGALRILGVLSLWRKPEGMDDIQYRVRTASVELSLFENQADL